MKDFLYWYYKDGFLHFVEIWKNYILFIWHYFSIGRFSRTIFSSWRRDVSRVNEVGLHPILFLKSLLENILTRIVGAILKIFLILLGFFLEFVAMFFFFLLFVSFILAPVFFLFFIFAIIYFIFENYFPGFVLLFFSFLSFSIIAISFSAYNFKNKELSSMPLSKLSQEKWFERILGRMGVDKNSSNLENFSNSNFNDEKLLTFLRSIDISKDEFMNIVRREISNQIEKKEKIKFWSKEKLLSKSPIGRYWSYGYTNKLDRYSIDLCKHSKYQENFLVGRRNEFSELIQLLFRPVQNKVILIGEPGVGRDTLIQTLAKEIQESHVGGPLENKRLLELNIKEILNEKFTGISNEKMIEILFYEASRAGNIILVLKDMHEYLDPQGKDISPILTDFLPIPTFQIVGTTNISDFHAKIEKNSALMKYFEKIILQEMEEPETIEVLFNKLKDLERKRIFFTYPALREIVKLSDRYIKDVPFPEKALDVLEEVFLHWKSHSESEFITEKTVAKTLSKKFNISLGELEENEGEKLINLEKYLHQQIIGQDFAIRQIAETMRRARIGMNQKNKPLGSFLFLGPTGVGKTESAKALARSYFGSENKIIRLDMSEYQLQSSIDRMIGSLENKTEGYLSSKIKESPFSLLLLDEIEKAHPDILNLFLQILDEGFFTDAFGKKISFSNLIIIATSNAGAEKIRESVQKKLAPEEIQKQITDYVIRKGIFKPEFLNRFEDVVFFNPLSLEESSKVTKLLLAKYAERLKEQENIGISFEEGLEEIIAKNSYTPEFGARAIDRYIKDKIEDFVVKKIISGEIKKGTDFILQISDLEIN